MNFYAGVDGGGTKTAVLCMNERGETTARAIFGPFNITSVGREGLRRVMDEILGFICAQGNCLRLCIGAAGAGSAALGREVAAVMADYPNIPYELVGDYEVARCGALGGRPGVALVAGTGSVCSGVNAAGETFRVGGWGHLIGDAGSAYWIGRTAMEAAMRGHDGRRRLTTLTKALSEEFPDLEAAYVELQSDPGRVARIAAFSRRVDELSASDRVAGNILDKAAAHLSEAVQAAIRRAHLSAPQPPRVAAVGSVFRHERVLRRFTDYLTLQWPSFALCEPVGGPVDGAAALHALDPAHPLYSRLTAAER